MNKFTVPKPCHENWENMLPEEQGRFCASCKKKVYDFTEKSAEEIQFIFDEQKGNLCGKFESTQLIHFTKFQKLVLKIDHFTHHHFSKFGILVSAVSLLMMIAGCSDKKNTTQISEDSKMPEEIIQSKDQSIVLGKMIIEETDSTTHYLKNLDDVKPINGSALKPPIKPIIKPPKIQIGKPHPVTMGVPIHVPEKDSLK